MYEVTQDYLDKATAAGRVYSLRVDVGEVVDGAFVDKAQYLGGVGVLSLKIVRGQTTGGFSLGGTVCAQLSATFTNDVDVRVKDRLQVYVRFGSGSEATAWKSLGWFYVDAVKQGLYNKSVTAYDAMLRLEKNYKSKLTYPAKTSDVLNEISDQTNINLSSSLSLINDATIETMPQLDKSKDGEQRYYTRRAMLGYIAATNAGEAYIDVDFKINLAVPTETGYTIEAASVVSQTVDDTDFMIDGIVWNKSGISYSLNDDFTENTVELTNPLEYTSEEQILHNLETKLVGLSYSSITLKKQGTGIFQLGDLVNYVALDGTTYTMLVMGVVYDFSNGFFSETLYSLAKSASQQEYTGSQVTDQQGYATVTSGASLSNYEYLTDWSVKFNGITYTADIDDSTGLISKISDDSGNEFEPSINSGITNVNVHNAVLMAVAMCRGLAKTVKFDDTGIFAFYDMSTLDIGNSVWSNKLSSNYNITLVGGNKENKCLHLTTSDYGVLTCDEPMTIYMLLKTVYIDGNFRTAMSKHMTSDARRHDFAIGVTPYVMLSGRQSNVTSNVDARVSRVVCITRSTTSAKLYVDGVYVGSAATALGDYYGEFMLNKSIRGSVTSAYDLPGNHYYRMLAVGNQEHTAEQISLNTKYILETYGSI